MRALEAIAGELRETVRRVTPAAALVGSGWSGAAAAQFGRATDSHVAVVAATTDVLDALTAELRRFHGLVIDLDERADRIHRERDDLRDSAVMLHGRRDIAVTSGDAVAVAAIDRQLADCADHAARLDRERATLDEELGQAQARLAAYLGDVIPPGLLQQASAIADSAAMAGLVAGAIRIGTGAGQVAWRRWRESSPGETTAAARAIVPCPVRPQPAADTSLVATALSRFMSAQAQQRLPGGELPGHRMRCGPVRSVVTRPWPRMRSGPVRRVLDDRLDLAVAP